MADRYLQRTRQRARIERTPEVRRRLLVARLRAGEIDRHQLHLAAYLGDPDATVVADRWARKASRHMRRYARGLARFGESAARRAAICVHRAMVDGLPDLPEPRGYWRRNRATVPQSYRLALEQVRVWGVAEAAGNQRAADEARAAALVYLARYQRTLEAQGYYEPPLPPQRLSLVLSGAASASLEATYLDAVRWLAPSGSRWGWAQADAGLRKRLAERLIPWALDHGARR
jgi:hypothetical protein